MNLRKGKGYAFYPSRDSAPPVSLLRCDGVGWRRCIVCHAAGTKWPPGAPCLAIQCMQIIFLETTLPEDALRLQEARHRLLSGLWPIFLTETSRRRPGAKVQAVEAVQVSGSRCEEPVEAAPLQLLARLAARCEYSYVCVCVCVMECSR